MNINDRQIVNLYKTKCNIYKQLELCAFDEIIAKLKENNIFYMEVAHRTKNVESLEEKIRKKSGKYKNLDDITDLCGIRIICYFSDDVDKIGKIIEENFIVDIENSIDKRKAIQETSFGYLSLHMVCSLKPSSCENNEELVGKKFEIQIRTALQHTWAEIEHDLGYKSEFGVPKKLRREFSRIAGLLEIADGQFVSLRDNLNSYSDEIKRKIKDDEADEIEIDRISLEEYMKHNKSMDAFLNKISSETGAYIEYINPESYIEQLSWLGVETIGDLSRMLATNEQLAAKMAIERIKMAELDIVSTNTALRYICRAELRQNNYTKEQIIRFLKIAIDDDARIEIYADRIINYKI